MLLCLLLSLRLCVSAREPVCKLAIYLRTMQTRLMQLMASKLTSILAKKVTHIEITGGDLEKMLGEANNPVQAQFSLF